MMACCANGVLTGPKFSHFYLRYVTPVYQVMGGRTAGMRDPVSLFVSKSVEPLGRSEETWRDC